ncbi:MAG: hypothetical protein KAI47_23520, partial [Deltaproteobacteria bacterium]|nr:hypothetical protein [Deltaproteobacteria bacterium]
MDEGGASKVVEPPKLKLLDDDYVAVEGRDEGRDEVIVGIDFGTSTSSVALLGDGGIEMVPIE